MSSLNDSSRSLNVEENEKNNSLKEDNVKLKTWLLIISGIGAALLLICIILVAVSAHGGPEDKVFFVDTHTHAWEGEYFTPPPRRYTPPHDNPWEKLACNLWENRFDFVVLVQPSFLGTNNTIITNHLKKSKFTRGVVVLDPKITKEEFLKLHNLGARGIRLNLKGADMDKFYADFSGTDYQNLVGMIKEYNWHIEAQQVSTNWVKLIEVLLKTNCRLVVDHFSRPNANLGVKDPGFKAVLEAGKTGRVWMKTSAMYRQGASDSQVKEYVDLVIKNFGIKKILWGSDYPYVSKDVNFEVSQNYTKLLHVMKTIWYPKKEDQLQILMKNPSELYDIKYK